MLSGIDGALCYIALTYRRRIRFSSGPIYFINRYILQLYACMLKVLNSKGASDLHRPSNSFDKKSLRKKCSQKNSILILMLAFNELLSIPQSIPWNVLCSCLWDLDYYKPKHHSFWVGNISLSPEVVFVLSLTVIRTLLIRVLRLLDK